MGIREYSRAGALSFEMQDRIESELDRDEKLVWSGRQMAVRRQILAALPISIFGVFFGGFAIFWIAMALFMVWGSGSDDVPFFFRYFFPLFGIPFLLIGLGLMSSPVWVYRRARRTFYALTTKRAIVWQAGAFGALNVRIYRPDDLQKMVRNEYGDGSGDLIFEEYETTSVSRRNRHHRHHVHRIGFIGINNVRDVERQVRETLLRGEPM